jgi:hypothetical protein
MKAALTVARRLNSPLASCRLRLHALRLARGTWETESAGSLVDGPVPVSAAVQVCCRVAPSTATRSSFGAEARASKAKT